MTIQETKKIDSVHTWQYQCCPPTVQLGLHIGLPFLQANTKTSLVERKTPSPVEHYETLIFCVLLIFNCILTTVVASCKFLIQIGIYISWTLMIQSCVISWYMEKSQSEQEKSHSWRFWQQCSENFVGLRNWGLWKIPTWHGTISLPKINIKRHLNQPSLIRRILFEKESSKSDY